jgi:hypothetical protein
MRWARGIARAATRRPASVKATISRRESSRSGLVVVMPRRVSRSITPLIVGPSIAVRRPSRFCETDPCSYNRTIAENCVGVRSSTIISLKMARCRCVTWRSTKPTFSSRT